MLLNIFFLYVCIYETQSLLCYNGTFSSKYYARDPLQTNGLFAPSRREVSRLRCSFSSSCLGKRDAYAITGVGDLALCKPPAKPAMCSVLSIFLVCFNTTI
jgi:hypothetical protein